MKSQLWKTAKVAAASCATVLVVNHQTSTPIENYFFSSSDTTKPSTLLSTTAFASGAVNSTKPIRCRDGTAVFPWSAPPREAHLENLRTKTFDVLVVGGGCVGCGVALDAQTRGLRAALVEREDFAAGTSGRSTKLIHGGVRYLENAVKHLDWGQYLLVKEALHERGHMLKACPYLARALPIMIPIEKFYNIPVYFIGTKLYDFIAGRELTVPPSMYIGKTQAKYVFPMLKEERLYGAMVYYDGQMNDTRYALLIALTAAQSGATVLNHTNIERLTINEKTGKVNGAIARDLMTGELIRIKARSVVNCTGPFSDSLRRQAFDLTHASGTEQLTESANKNTTKTFVSKSKALEEVLDKFEDIVVPAGGIHVMLPDHFSPDNMGLIVPETTDGRVLFFLPWEGGTLCGTTDSKGDITMTPRAKKEEVDFVLAESSRYLNKPVRREDVLAAWAGIRPLVKDLKHNQGPKNATKVKSTENIKLDTAADKVTQQSDKENKVAEGQNKSVVVEKGNPISDLSSESKEESTTKSISREHVIEVSSGDMITAVGGKWTTYRQMAEDAVNKLLDINSVLKSKSGPCVTKSLMLVGSDRANIVCAQRFDIINVTLRQRYGFDRDIATHLTRNYGTRALQVAEIVLAGYPGREKNLHPKRLHPKYPYLEAEIIFAVTQEYCLSPRDFLLRRTRLSFVDTAAAVSSVQNVADIMATLLGWSEKRKQQEIKETIEMISTLNVKFGDEEEWE